MNRIGLRSTAVILVILLTLGSYLTFLTSKRNQIAAKRESTRIPVLMYHHFQREIPSGLETTIVTPDEFEDHLRSFKEEGYQSISFYDYYQYVKNNKTIPEKAFILTIDDGYVSNYTEALPLLKKYKTKAAISIVVSTVGKTPGSFPHFTWEQAKEMEQTGLVEIYNHTYDHQVCSKMSKDELIKNVMQAQNDIEKNLGKRKLKVFTYPEGKFTKETQDVIEKLGFDIQLTVKEGLIDHNTPVNAINRINIEHGLSGRDLIAHIQKLKNLKD